MTIGLISDLHLSSDNPKLLALFDTFMQTVAPRLSELYILGDLFEVFIGEDPNDACQQHVFKALHALSQSGTKVYLMAGNRDFLYSKSALKRHGIHYLHDPHVLQSHALLLTHGDRLNLADTAYLRYRKIAQHPLVKWLFLHLPQSIRQGIADRLRQKSQSVVIHYEDSTPAEVKRWCDRHQTRRMLHGHTHIPLIQLTDFKQDSAPLQRIVLSDWGAMGHYCLLSGDHPPELHSFQIDGES